MISLQAMTYPSTESMTNAFMTNEITVLSSDFYKLAQTSTKSRVNKYEYISDYFTFLGFNTENEYLKNVYTRYGIASCINKNEMINCMLKLAYYYNFYYITFCLQNQEVIIDKYSFVFL